MSAEAHHTFVAVDPKQPVTELGQVSAAAGQQQLPQGSRGAETGRSGLFFLPIQCTTDEGAADLTEVSGRQANRTTSLVTEDNAIPSGQTATGQTLHLITALETMEEDPDGLDQHWAAELQVPNTTSVLLPTNTPASVRPPAFPPVTQEPIVVCETSPRPSGATNAFGCSLFPW